MHFLDLQSGEQSPEERAAFVDWLRESPVHVSELLRTARLYRRLQRFGRWDDVKAPEEGEAAAVRKAQVIPFRPLRPLPRPRVFTVRRLAAAACIVAITLTAVLYPLVRRGQIVSTADQWRRVTMADGSAVDLAPNSAVRQAFSHAARTVYLDRGEAFFEVHKNPSRPFLVVAGNTVTRAVGTAFDVNRRDRGQIAVTVVEGVVQLKASRRTDAQRLIEGTAAATVLSLQANEEVLISTVSGAATPIRRVNGQAEVAWATGELDFDNEAVASVIASFNRFNPVHIDVADPVIAGRRVSGSFHTNDPGSFLAFLVSTADVRVRESPDRIIIERK